MQLGSGPWLHSIEIRFLLSEGAHAPLKEGESLKNKPAHLVRVPKGFVLYANLIVGAAGTLPNCPLPVEFLPAGQPLWRTQLRDGRPAVLVGRILELDGKNRDHINYIRTILKPTVTSSGVPGNDFYVETINLKWSAEGGNIALVVPMGDEAMRYEQEVTSATEPVLEPRKFLYQSPRCTADVIAPNGQRVALLEFDEVDKQLELVKNRPSTHEVGTLRMQLEPGNLIPGNKFIASPCRLACVPSIGGGSPLNWRYTVYAGFDGTMLSAEVRQISASLRSKNLALAVSGLEAREEIVITIPPENLKLLATMESPATSASVLGKFNLRDWR